MGKARTTSRLLTRSMVAAAAVAAVGISAGGTAFAASDPADATPENIVLTPAKHADTAQSFTWRTGSKVTGGQVHIRKAGTKSWRVVNAKLNEELVSAGVPTRTHSATIDELKPGTRYEYYVGNAAEASRTYTFTTAGAAGDPFSFIYFGDAQNDIAEKWSPVVTQAFQRFPDAVGTVNAGDLVDVGSDDSEWTEWFGAMNGYSQTRNVIAAPGNHEFKDNSFLKQWKSNFEFPGDGPVAATKAAKGMTDGEKQTAAYEAQMQIALDETAYYTDYQGVRFISLNASRSEAIPLFTPANLPECHVACPNPTELWLTMQRQWLDAALRNNPNKWAVAVFHQPVFSAAEGRDEADLRAAWLPVFERDDIDLVLMGHDHNYVRGYVDADKTNKPGVTTGPVYTVAVSGPKYYEPAPADDNTWTQNGATQVTSAAHTSTFQGITVSKDQIHYESVVAGKWDGQSTTDVPVGGTLDAFTITKYDDGEKYVTEAGKPVPAPKSTGKVSPRRTADEVDAQEPAEVRLGHSVAGTLGGPTVAQPGPTTVNPTTGAVYLADGTGTGKGRVEALDPATGKVTGSFEAGAPIKDLSYDAAFNGVLVVYQDGRIASFVVTPGHFGDPYIPPIPTGLPVVSTQYDAYTGQVFLATADGKVVWLDENFQPVGQANIGAGLSAIRLDDATGVLYVAYGNGLRLYETRNGMKELAEYKLDAGVGALDVDTNSGIAYVGHTTGGLSIVDLVRGKVTSLEKGKPVAGVGVDPRRGMIYLAGGTKASGTTKSGTTKSGTTASATKVTVVGRDQAPAIDASPVSKIAVAGDTVTFDAAAHAFPAPSVSWEKRERNGKWVEIRHADGNVLKVSATQEGDGTQYRAVYRNVIDGKRYSTHSASATLRVVPKRGHGA
ncbi:fibronectin type III domain-containing protein [Actinoplanes sp. TBRC 11911]|uniref:fibronectin type III domain-containing protein n=1 Tax=Actinoplanes sp. TBRC 11911 TaxID=2729386 RepID=UPI001B7D67F1|nr:fibronectin type III domain-containing protein [Actinoplanes sp. TBRC 11911]